MAAERGTMDNIAVMADQNTVLGRIPGGVHAATAEIELEASTLLVKELLRHAQAHLERRRTARSMGLFAESDYGLGERESQPGADGGSYGS